MAWSLETSVETGRAGGAMSAGMKVACPSWKLAGAWAGPSDGKFPFLAFESFFKKRQHDAVLGDHAGSTGT